MSVDILNEYVKVTSTINNIQDKLNRYKKQVQNKLDSAKSEKERDLIVKDFQENIDKMKNDSEIKRKYLNLKKKQKEGVIDGIACCCLVASLIGSQA